MKIIEAMHWGETQLKSNGVEDPRCDADLLLAHVLGLTRDRLYLERERELTESELVKFQDLIRRRGEREPIQYILGRQEFMGLEFYVNENVLIPRADSEILVEKLLEQGKKIPEYPRNKDLPIQKGPEEKAPAVLDLCTGSGALAIVIAHYWPQACVVGTDLSEKALEVARYNGERLGVSVEWRQGDFLEPARGELWDFIITNPPYVSSSEYAACAPEIHREPAMAFLGGEDGLIFYRRLAKEVRPLLAPKGKILMEIGWEQAISVQAIWEAEGFVTEVFKDLAGRDRVILAR